MDTCLAPADERLMLPNWPARLALSFARSSTSTRLRACEHVGPLRVQRLLYPEGRDCAHALILHPPGGTAGGDELDVRLDLAAEARVLATTPGAGKWYHGERGVARQDVHLQVADGACLEWLPQEAILFDGARVRQRMQIDLAADAAMFGWDIVQLGRLAAGERWSTGHWSQMLELRRAGDLCWLEQAELAANDRLRDSPLGLAGQPVFATAWATSPALSASIGDALDAARTASVRFSPRCGITWLPAPANLLLLRALGSDCAVVRELLEEIWGALRPWVAGRAAQRPRIWNT